MKIYKVVVIGYMDLIIIYNNWKIILEEISDIKTTIHKLKKINYYNNV